MAQRGFTLIEVVVAMVIIARELAVTGLRGLAADRGVVIAAIPVVGGIVWVAGAVFGLGSSTVAIWRARGVAPRVRLSGGRHRPGGKMRVVIPATSDEPEPMIVEREMGEEGAGL